MSDKTRRKRKANIDSATESISPAELKGANGAKQPAVVAAKKACKTEPNALLQKKLAPDSFTIPIAAENPTAATDVLFDPWCDPAKPLKINFQDVSTAAFNIRGGVIHTSCTRSHGLSRQLGVDLYFKKEFLQETGSFKERGARFALLRLSKDQRAKGVIAASAGNHALALSYHGTLLNIPVTVVMPRVAPLMKVSACRTHGANVIVHGGHIGESKELALTMAREKGLLYINGYDHPHILAGQGTIGLEILESVDNLDAIVIPVGGGGMIAGIATAVKHLQPNVTIIGVETDTAPGFTESLKNGHPTRIDVLSTIADGCAVPLIGCNSFATANGLIDKMVTVNEGQVALAILRLIEVEKNVVEGAGALGVAAVLAGLLPELEGKRIVIPLTGGNIDTTVLGRAIEKGMAADGRLVRALVTVSDRAGGIAELTGIIASKGASLKDIFHERAWLKGDVFSVRVKLILETNDLVHAKEVETAIIARYGAAQVKMLTTQSGDDGDNV